MFLLSALLGMELAIRAANVLAKEDPPVEIVQQGKSNIISGKKTGRELVENW